MQKQPDTSKPVSKSDKPSQPKTPIPPVQYRWERSQSPVKIPGPDTQAYKIFHAFNPGQEMTTSECQRVSGIHSGEVSLLFHSGILERRPCKRLHQFIYRRHILNDLTPGEPLRFISEGLISEPVDSELAQWERSGPVIVPGENSITYGIFRLFKPRQVMTTSQCRQAASESNSLAQYYSKSKIILSPLFRAGLLERRLCKDQARRYVYRRHILNDPRSKEPLRFIEVVPEKAVSKEPDVMTAFVEEELKSKSIQLPLKTLQTRTLQTIENSLQGEEEESEPPSLLLGTLEDELKNAKERCEKLRKLIQLVKALAGPSLSFVTGSDKKALEIRALIAKKLLRDAGGKLFFQDLHAQMNAEIGEKLSKDKVMSAIKKLNIRPYKIGGRKNVVDLKNVMDPAKGPTLPRDITGDS